MFALVQLTLMMSSGRAARMPRQLESRFKVRGDQARVLVGNCRHGEDGNAAHGARLGFPNLLGSLENDAASTFLRSLAIALKGGSRRFVVCRNLVGPEGDKILYDCFLCRRPFQFGPHVYKGKPIPEWEIEICDTCLRSNWDGLVPGAHPRLIEHFKAKGITPKLNASGWIVIPGQ